MGSGIELYKYKCHKEVWAGKILGIEEYNRVLHITVGDWTARVTVGDDYFNKHCPEVGGYYILYKDGYESWSPPEAFEDGYTLIEDNCSCS